MNHSPPQQQRSQAKKKRFGPWGTYGPHESLPSPDSPSGGSRPSPLRGTARRRGAPTAREAAAQSTTAAPHGGETRPRADRPPPGGGPRSRGDRPPLKERRGPHSDRPSWGSEQEIGSAGRPPASSSQRSPARSPPTPHRDRSQRDPLSARGSALPRWQRRPRCATQPGRNGLLTPPYAQLELGFVQVLHIVAQEAVQQIRHHRLQHHGGGGPTTRRPRPTVSGERRGGEGKRDGRRGAARGSARRVPAVR